MTLSALHTHHADVPSMLADGAPTSTGRSASNAHAQDAPLAGVQIMVVNCTSESCVHLQACLGAAGATVICAYDLDTVLATIARTPPDLILEDLDVPSDEPYQSIRQVRLHERNKTLLTRLPAIAVGVRGASMDVRAALQAGFDEHLAKPHTDAELIALVASYTCGK